MVPETPIAPERLSALQTLSLGKGNHADFEKGVCVMEAVAYVAGEPHSDHPKCASEVLTSFLMRLNDGLPDDLRQELKPYIPRVIGTADDGQDEARSWLLANWAVRTAIPMWLEQAGITESAEYLRSLPEITADSDKSWKKRMPAIRKEAYAARSKAYDRLRSKVREEFEKRGLNAVAAAAAAAVDAAAAAAAGLNLKYGTDGYWAFRNAFRKIFRSKVQDVVAPVQQSLMGSVRELLDQVIDPSAAERKTEA